MAKKIRSKVLNKPKKTNKPYSLQLTAYSLQLFIIVFFLILALVTRCIHLQSIEKNDPTFYQLPYGTDMTTYDNQAQNILKGRHPAPFSYNPLYSYFLSFVYLIFGHDVYIARFIQHLFGILTLFFVFLIARRVFDNRVGLISLAIGIFYEMFLIHEGLFLPEFLASLLNTILIFLFLRIERNSSFKNIALAGIFLALSALTRPNILVFLPFIFIWMFVVLGRKAIIAFPFFLIITFLFIMPATLMNYIHSKKFILISTNGPINLWIGNNEQANGDYIHFSPSKRLEKRLKEIGDKAYIEDVIRFIREEPGMWIGLNIKKFLLFWGNFEIANNMNYNQIKEWSKILKMPFFFGFGVVAPFCLLGIFLALRRKESLILLFYVFSFMFSTLPFAILARHKVVAIPIFIIFSSFSLLWLYERVLKKEYKKILFLSPVILFSFLLVWNNEIYSFSFPFIHSEGIHIRENGKTIIMDASDKWKGGDAIILSDKNRVKKELIIQEDLSLYKSAEIFFKYCVDEFPGILTLAVNDSHSIPLRLGISTQGLIKVFFFPIPINSLKKGKNSFVFSLEGQSHFALLYDTTYSFGRSYQLTREGDFKKIKKGEFIVWLNLKKGE